MTFVAERFSRAETCITNLKEQLAVCVFPGLGGENPGGIQDSGRLVWRAVAAHAWRQQMTAGLIVYGQAEVEDVQLAGRCCRHGNRFGLIWGLLRSRWRAPVVYFHHLGLLRLLPFMGVGPARVVLFLHGIESWRRLGSLTGRLLQRVDLFLSNSDFTWRRFLDHNPSLAKRPWARVHLGCGEACELSPSPDAVPTALMLARLARSEDYKGHREVIAAWPQVLALVPNARLWIAGDGNLRPELQELVCRQGLTNCVRFWGRVDEQQKIDLLRRSRCLLMPSRGEGFGLVYLEAMRLGRPCLVSDCDAGREVVNPPEAGLAVDPANGPPLADACYRLLSSGSQWEEWSRAARERFAARFTATRYQQRLIQALFPSHQDDLQSTVQ
jgi:phosphatidylinositol alpha-1,6-mannosyltransferase